MDPQVPTQPVSPVTPPSVSPVKKGMNWWMIASIVLFVLLIAGGAYVLGKNQSYVPLQTMYPSPTVSQQMVSPTSGVSPTAAANSGSISGTLCYPGDMIPAGTITAKNVSTQEEVTQNYVGSDKGGSSSYTLDVKPGSYHLKFTPTQYSNVVGYYTTYSTCVGNPNGPDCTGQKTRPLITAKIMAGDSLTNANLCDYYYPPANPPQF